MFYSTDISVTLWILNNNKKGGPWHGRQLRNRTGEVLFIDLRTWNNNIYEKKYVRLSETEINRVSQIYFNWQTWEFCRVCRAGIILCCASRRNSKKGIFPRTFQIYWVYWPRYRKLDYKSALSEMSYKFDVLKKRWDTNETELVNAFKVLGYGKE